MKRFYIRIINIIKKYLEYPCVPRYQKNMIIRFVNKLIAMVFIFFIILGLSCSKKKENVEKYFQHINLDISRGEYLLYGEKSKIWKVKNDLEKMDKDLWVYERLAYTYLYLGDIESALKYGLEAVKEGTSDPKVINLSANLLYNKNELEKALELYRKTLEIDSENLTALYNAALILFDNNTLIDSRKMLNHVLAKKTDYYDANFLLGSISEKENNLEEAKKYYEKELNLYPAHPDVNYRMASILQNENTEIEIIIHHLYLAVSSSPFNQKYRKDLITAYEKKGGDCLNIAADEKKLLEMQDMDSTLYNYAHYLIQSNNDIDEAIKAIKKQIDKYPKYPGAYSLLGNLFMEKSMYTEAFVCFNKEIENNPNNIVLWYNNAMDSYRRGIENKDLKSVIKSKQMVDKCLAIDPLDKLSLDLKQDINRSLSSVSGQ